MRILIGITGFAFFLAILLFSVMGLFYVSFSKALLINGWILFALTYGCGGLLNGAKQVCPSCGHITGLDILKIGTGAMDVCGNCGSPALHSGNIGDRILSSGAIGCFISLPIFFILWAIFAAISLPGPGIGWPPMEEYPSLTYSIAVTGYIQGILWSWFLAKEFYG
jgi:hypothetical protein